MTSSHRILFALLVTSLASACPAPLTPGSNPAFKPGGPTNPPPQALSGTKLKPVKLSDGNDGTPATLADVKKYQALTHGTLVHTLPKHWAFQTIRIKRQGTGAGDEVGMGIASPAEEDALFEADPNLLDEDASIYSLDDDLSTQALGLFQIAQVPAAVDLRPEMPPVMNQGEWGVCEIASVAGVMDYLYARQANAPIKQTSVQFLYWNYHRNIVSKTDVGQLWKDPGTISTYLGMILNRAGNREISPNAPFVPQNQGYVSASDVPYVSKKYPPEPENPDLTTVARRHLGAFADRITGTESIQGQGVQQTMLDTKSTRALKTALSEGHPIVIGYPVFSADWDDASATNDIIPDMTAEKTGQTGGHAVVLVGYQDDPQAPGGGYFIVRNSWGTDWGNAGHCRISYKMTQEYGDDAYILTPQEPFAATFAILYPPHEPGGQPLSKLVYPAGSPEPSQISIVAPTAKPTSADADQ